MSRAKIYQRIDDERAYQDGKWSATDDQNTEYNWAAYIGAYTNRSLIGAPGDSELRRARFIEDMYKVAALAVAAIEKL